MVDLFRYIEKRNPEFIGLKGITSTTDAIARDIYYKDGAATGCTAGRVGRAEAVMFQKGVANVAAEEQGNGALSTGNVERAKLISFHQVEERGSSICAPGDSGCGVFSPDLDQDGWSWVGQLVSLLAGVETVGLIIPQSEILESLRANTGLSWRLCNR